jgi:cytochrome c-type biogenesis protein CcmH
MARLRAALASPAAWGMLAVVVAAALVVGSVHPGPAGQAARIARLDSIIKCPSCEDLSIAQSEALTALALRSFVAAGVASGESDSQIEDAVVARYGPGILLQPRNPLVWVLPSVGTVAAAVLVGAVMWRRRRGATGPAAVPGAPAGEDEALVASALAGRRGSDDQPA